MGEQTFTTLELNCPGCGAFFRLKPKRGRLPKGPIPCPKCSTPIPVPKPDASAPDKKEETSASTDSTAPAPSKPPQAKIMGRGILKRKKKLPEQPETPEPEARVPTSTHPLDILDKALDEEQDNPSATFLGFPTLDNSGFTALKNKIQQTPEPLSTQELETGQAPENSNAPWLNPFEEDKPKDQGAFDREPTIVDDHSIIDKLRRAQNTQEVEAVQGNPLRDTKDLSPLDPSKPLRDTKEFDPLEKSDRQTPISMDKLDKLFDDDQSNQQAKVKPQDVSWKDDAAGPFDLRDILEAEKNLGNDISGEITRNPALDESIYPTGEHKPAKPLPEDSFSSKMDKPKSSQLSKLSLSSAKPSPMMETSDRSNSGAFQHARVSTGDIFSETSAALQDDVIGLSPDESNIPLPTPVLPGESGFGTTPDKPKTMQTTAEVDEPFLAPQTPANKPLPPTDLVAKSPELVFDFDSELSTAAPTAIEAPQEKNEAEEPSTPEEIVDDPSVEAPVDTPAVPDTKEPPKKMALASLLKKKVNRSKLDKLRTSLERSSEVSEAIASANSTPTLEQTDEHVSHADVFSEASDVTDDEDNGQEESLEAARATDEFDAQSLASISEAVFDGTPLFGADKSQETIELRDVDELVAQTESTSPKVDVPDTLRVEQDDTAKDSEDKATPPALNTNVRGTITGQHLALTSDDAEVEAPEPAKPIKRLDLKSALQRKLAQKAKGEDDEFESSKSTFFGTPTSDAHDDELDELIEDAPEPEIVQPPALPKSMPPTPDIKLGQDKLADTPVDSPTNKPEIDLDLSDLKLEAPSVTNAFPDTPATAAALSSPTEKQLEVKEDIRSQSGIPLISGFPSPSSKSTEDLKIIRSKRRKPGDSQSGMFAQPLAHSLSQESSVTLGAASERRGSGYIRLPTTEILEVLGEGTYRLMVEDIIYEPVDEQGLTALIKQGVLLGAEQMAEADGDWMPIAEHPVFRRLRRKMAIEAHALLAKYKRKSVEANENEEPAPRLIHERFASTRPMHAVTPKASQDPYGPSDAIEDAEPDSVHDEATKQMERPSIPSPPGGLFGASDEARDEALPAIISTENTEAFSDSNIVDAISDVEEPGTEEHIHVADDNVASDEDTDHEDASTQQGVDEPLNDVEDEVKPLLAPTPESQPDTNTADELVDDASEDSDTQVETIQPAASIEPEPTTSPESPKPSARPNVPNTTLDDDPLDSPPSSGGGVKWVLGLILIAAIVIGAMALLKPELLGLKPKAQPTPKVAVKTNTKTAAKKDTVPKTDPPETNNKPNKVDPPDIKKSPLALAMDKDKAGDHAGAVALLKPLYEKAPADIEQTLLYARTLNKAKQYREARVVAVKALALNTAKNDEKGRLEEIYKQSIINDPVLTQTKAMLLEPGKNMDGIEYIPEQKKYLYVKIRNNGQAKFIFKPAQVEWNDKWRSDVASWRLCQMLVCHFEVPKTIPAKIKKSDFINMMKAVKSDSQVKGLSRVVGGDELNYRKEKNAKGDTEQYVYGALQTYYPDAVSFPVEYKALWAAMINVTEEEKELKRPINEVLSLFKRVGGGKYYEPIAKAIGNTTTEGLITQMSSLLVFDYLINHRPRFAKRSKQYGTSTYLHDGNLLTLHHGMSWPKGRASNTVRSRFRYSSRFSRSMVKSLELIDPKFANDVLYPDTTKVEKRQLKVFWKQRKNALKGINNLKSKYTDESVLFLP